MNNVGPLLLIILSLGLFYLFIDPQYEKFNTLWQDNGEYRDAIVEAGKIDDLKRTLLEKQESFSPDDRARLEKMIPQKVDVVALTNDLSTLAVSHGVSIISVREEGGIIEKQDATYKSVNIAVRARATYKSFLAFAKSIETSLRLMDVVGITFGGTTPNGVFDVSLTVQAYSLE